MKLKRERLLGLLAVWLLSACAGSPQTAAPSDRLAQLSAQRPLPAGAIKQLAAQAREVNDINTEARAWWLLCQQGVMQGNDKTSCEQSLDIAVANTLLPQQVSSLVALYYLTNNDVYLRKAQVLAPVDPQVVAIEANSSREDCNEQKISPVSAMRCYQLGKAHSDARLLTLALQQFEHFGAEHKAADTLFLLAKLALQTGDIHQAELYCARSAYLLTVLGESKKAEFVRDWRREFIYAR